MWPPARSVASNSNPGADRADTRTLVRAAGSMSRPMRSAVPAASGSKTDSHQLSGPRTVQQPLYHSTASFLPSTGSPVERTPAHDETETPTDVGPEDVLPRPMLDVPDSVCGNLREPSGRRGRGERSQCAHGDDLGPGCESGPSARLVPPRRIRRSDAGRMAGPRRANSRSLAREAEARALMPQRRPDTLGPGERCLPVSLPGSINSGRGTQTTIGTDHRSGAEGSWPSL